MWTCVNIKYTEGIITMPTREEVAERREAVWEMHAAKFTISDIAEAVGVSEEVIKKDIQFCKKEKIQEVGEGSFIASCLVESISMFDVFLKQHSAEYRDCEDKDEKGRIEKKITDLIMKRADLVRKFLPDSTLAGLVKFRSGKSNNNAFKEWKKKHVENVVKSG